jgi:hypothetical protein
MDREIARIKSRYREARYVGISDGASDYLPWLKGHTTTQILDFWHVSEYIHAAAAAISRRKSEQEAWIEESCHALKHDHGAARRILAQLQEAALKSQSQRAAQALAKAVSYFENNLERMNYASYRKSHLPIGSGVTEAACKALVKQRMCGSGMKWRHLGAESVLRLRALTMSCERWEEFWRQVAIFGFSKLPAA